MSEFAARGFDGAATRAIATRAGVAQAVVLYHFKTKDDLWKAAADRIQRELREQYQTRAAGLEGVDVRTRARLLVGDYVRFAAKHPELHRFMLQEGTEPSERLEWLVDTHVRPQVQMFRELVRDLEADGVTIRGRADHLWYMLIGAAATPYAVAPEFELVMDADPFSDDMVEAHVEAVLQLFFPDLSGDQPRRDL